MGVVFSRIRKARKVVFLGLSNSGKSSVVNILEKEYNKTDLEQPSPTQGFKVSLLRRNNRNINVWELGGDDDTIQFWKCYFTNVNGIVFVIDGSDPNNKHRSISLLYDISREKSLEGVAILILIHKSGKEIDIAEINKNGVHIFGKRKFRAFDTSTESPETVVSAFEWLLNTIG